MATDTPVSLGGAATDMVRGAPVVSTQHAEIGVVRIDTGTLRAAFLPDVGARLISLEHAGRELLWRNPDLLDAELAAVRPRSLWPIPDGTMGSWANVGGAKTWPAPQGWNGDHEWPGPPDPILDAGAWTTAVATPTQNSVCIEFTSPDDPRTGLRVSRAFTFTSGASAFQERITFRAAGERSVRWAIWEVVQIATESDHDVDAAADEGVGTFVSVAPPSTAVDLLAGGDSTPSRSAGPGVLRIPPNPHVAKIGFPTASGSIRHVRGDGLELQLDWPVRHDATYPDRGSRAEVWTQAPADEPIAELGGLHPRAHLVELEALGPLTLLRPGQSTNLTIDWRVTA